jgi:uncharacterized protein YqfA (UPF0365 family)
MPRLIRSVETDDIVFDDGVTIKIKKTMTVLDAAEIRKLVDKDDEDIVIATVFRNIVSWDLKEDDKIVPVTLESVKLLDNATVVVLFSAVGERNTLLKKDLMNKYTPVLSRGQTD